MNRSPAAVLLALFALCACHARAQETAVATGCAPVATAARVAPSEGSISGPLYVTVGGAERKVADAAVKAWIIRGGRQVVYSGLDGAGGYENEGQSLRAYDAATGRSRKLMSAYYMIDEVTEATTSAGRTALLVEMSDGGLGASYLAVVDPARGQVFFRRWVKLVSRRGDVISLGHYRERDWNRLNEGENARVRPYKVERQNLEALLRGRLITNRPI